MSLERALQALPSDPGTALAELLLSWQQQPCPEVAQLIEALDARFAAARGPVDGTTPGDEAWRQIERRRDPADVGRLLGAESPTGRVALRLELLAKQHKHDPRLAARVLDCIADRFPFSTEWYAFTTVLKRVGDARHVAPLRRIVATWPTPAPVPQEWAALGVSQASLAQYEVEMLALRKGVGELADRLERAARKAKPLPDDEARLIAPLAAAIATAENLDGAAAPARRKPAKAAAPARAGTADVDALLERALSERNDAEAQLATLLAAWRGLPVAALAELVERAGARVRREPLPDKPAPAALDAWIGCERAGDPADVDRLVAALQIGTVKQIIQRLTTLAARPPDPRLARAAAHLLETQPFRSGACRPLYTAACELLEASADPRALGFLEKVEREHLPGQGRDGGNDFREFFIAKLNRALTAARKRSAPPVNDSTLPKLEALATQLARGAAAAADEAQLAEQLLAAIWRDPADDHARQVYADFLVERGQPHGEFIALQLAAARGQSSAEASKRERALAREHARAFLGPLAPALSLKELRFERGFVVHAELNDRVSPQIHAIAAHPAWSTLRTCFAFYTRRTCPELLTHLERLGVRAFEDPHAYAAFRKQQGA